MGSETPLPDGMLDQFANTFREWHYFVGGFAIGFLLGIEYAYRRFKD